MRFSTPVIVLAASLLKLAAAVTVVTEDPKLMTQDSTDTSKANFPKWMAQMPDATPFNRMSIPGTHDLAS